MTIFLYCLAVYLVIGGVLATITLNSTIMKKRALRNKLHWSVILLAGLIIATTYPILYLYKTTQEGEDG